MHSVGIRRVFWTDKDGRWQGAKVRELVESLDGGLAATASDEENTVFVTKYEILRLYAARQPPVQASDGAPGGDWTSANQVAGYTQGAKAIVGARVAGNNNNICVKQAIWHQWRWID